MAGPSAGEAADERGGRRDADDDRQREDAEVERQMGVGSTDEQAAQRVDLVAERVDAAQRPAASPA